MPQSYAITVTKKKEENIALVQNGEEADHQAGFQGAAEHGRVA
jgi:hypothetical protein